MLAFIAACVLPSFAVAVVATAALRRWAPRWGLVDQPGPRKVHQQPTPLGGGLAIWLAVVLPLAAASMLACDCLPVGLAGWLPYGVADQVNIPAGLGRLWAILAGGTLLVAVGLIDDRRGLSWQFRLAVQLLVAVAIVAAGVRGTLFLPRPWQADWLNNLPGSVLSVLWILVLVNAFNFLDNMDGLSSGIGLIVAAMFAGVMLGSTAQPHWLVGGTLLVLAGALAGFLVHNRHPARIFMGDSGSYFIGLVLASLTIVGTFYNPVEASASASRHVILAPLFVLAIPLYDFTSVMLIRLSRGLSPFAADRNHFSHRLVELGLSPRDAVRTILLATLMTGLGGLLLYRVADWWGALLLLALILCVLALVAILETVGRRAGNGDG